MNEPKASAKMITRLFFRLLPVQILLAAVSSVNGIVSSFFATNYVGVDAMSAVGLYGPISTFLGAVSTMLAGGSAILCGKYLGRNEPEKVQSLFSLNMLFSALFAGLCCIVFLILGVFDLTGLFTRDSAVRPLFNRYLIGQVIGIFPLILGNQLPVYLSMENKQKRTMAASLIYIAVNLVLNYLFVQVLHLEAFGLALASSLGMWVFFAVQAQVFLNRKAHLQFRFRNLFLRDGLEILRVGFPGAASLGYQTIRGLIVNYLIGVFVGSVGISAFAASNNLLALFWSVPTGMLAVSRLMISISIGEEDRQTLTDVMRIMFNRFIPIMCAISAVIIICAEPFTRIFFQDPGESVYGMTVWCFRILPLCMPFSIIAMHFMCYGQASGKNVLVHVLALLDGFICVAGFTALLIQWLDLNSACIANVLNGVICLLFIVLYAWFNTKCFPRSMDQLMVIPEAFGADDDERLDITVHNMDEVLAVSRQITEFCQKRGLDKRRSYLASLCMEEMAGNVVDHGFTKDQKKHTVDIRVVHKDDDMILRIRDDCVPFDPEERKELIDPSDFMKNAGIRLVYKIAKDVDYQNLLGLNVLTIRI